MVENDGSYLLESFSDKKESEIERLQHQVNLFYRKESELYRRIGLKDGMKILDCGSGPGYLIRNIVNDLPNCTATALEIDDFLVKELKKNAVIDGQKLFEVKQASIYDTELPDGHFDFVMARLVLEHLKEPAKAIKEVRRVLKPGGTFVIVSNDFAYHLLTYPSIPELDEMYSAYINSRMREGGDPLIGRKLPKLLRRNGFDDVEIEVVCVHSELEGDKPFIKAENVNISKSLVNAGFLKKETLESLIESWYMMLQHPEHIIFRQLFVVSGTKIDQQTSLKKDVSDDAQAKNNLPSFSTEDLLNQDTTQQAEKLELYFKEKTRDIFEQRSTDQDFNIKLYDLDIDSIEAAELSSLIKSDFNVEISIANILQSLTINDIIKKILINLRQVSSEKNGTSEENDRTIWSEGEL